MTRRRPVAAASAAEEEEEGGGWFSSSSSGRSDARQSPPLSSVTKSSSSFAELKKRLVRLRAGVRARTRARARVRVRVRVRVSFGVRVRAEGAPRRRAVEEHEPLGRGEEERHGQLASREEGRLQLFLRHGGLTQGHEQLEEVPLHLD